MTSSYDFKEEKLHGATLRPTVCVVKKKKSAAENSNYLFKKLKTRLQVRVTGAKGEFQVQKGPLIKADTNKRSLVIMNKV